MSHLVHLLSTYRFLPALHAGLVLLLFLGGCNKVKKNELYADLRIRSSVSGMPVKARLELDYVDAYLFGSSPETIDLGETDAYGYIEIRQRLNKKIHSAEVRIYGYGYGNIMNNGYSRTIKLNLGEKNSQIVSVDPNYHYFLSATNANCFDATDTVRITIPGQTTPDYVLTGCADTVLRWAGHPMYTFSGWTLEQTLPCTVWVKRNGVESSFQQTFTLQEQEITQVHIDY